MAVDTIGRGAADRGRTGCIDATGRRAVTAVSVCRPPRTWTAATVTLPAGAEDDELHLAAAPDGYAYRLGSTRWTTLGWVGPGSPPRDAGELRRRIASSPGEWLLADIAAIESDRPTLRRPAGLAIPARPAGALAIGDAALTRDALASQGLSLGLSDAWHVADPVTGAADLAARHADGLNRLTGAAQRASVTPVVGGSHPFDLVHRRRTAQAVGARLAAGARPTGSGAGGVARRRADDDRRRAKGLVRSRTADRVAEGGDT